MSAGVILNNNPGNGGVMVTQVVPTPAILQNTVLAGPGVPVVIPVSTTGTSARRSLQKFLKGHPKHLGGFEIFTGVITLMLGIAMTIIGPTISVYSGIVYWGSIIYIIAGSLTVAGGTNLNSCLIKGSLGMNVVSAVVAGTAIILMSVDLAVLVYLLSQSEPPYGEYFPTPDVVQSDSIMTGILLVLSIVLFIISICLSAFGCKATCCIEPEVSVVTVTLDNAACSSMASPVHVHTGQQAVFYTNSSIAVNNLPAEQPPAYSPSQYETK